MLPFPLSLPSHPRPRDDRGQATPEYGLVVMVAGTIAITLIGWARTTDAITGLFDSVVEHLTRGF